MIIDATDLIAGRIASYSAKKALLGETVDIINAENALITGNKKEVLAHYKHKRDRGTPGKGPFYPRRANMILKRIIRGMLPHSQAKGREALKRIKCYIGVPESLNGKETQTIPGANKSKLETKKYISLKKLSENLGAK